MKTNDYGICKTEWCNNIPHSSGKGYCRTHYDQIRKHGHILNKRTRTSKNEIIIKGDYAEVILCNRGQEEVARALINIEDIPLAKMHRWSLKDNGYVRTVINGRTAYMHRLISNAKDGEEVDHINRDRLDNTRTNLRIVEHYVNMHNRDYGTNVFMITERKLCKPFRAVLDVNKERIWIGYFKTKEEAESAVFKEKEKRGVLMMSI